MNELIIGGTSGLGLDLARLDSEQNNVIITGRHDPNVDFAEFRKFDLDQGHLPKRIGEFVASLPHIDSMVYAAGFFQNGHIDDLNDEEVDTMLNVCQRGLIFFVKKLLEKQNELSELVTITSTSQWTPREFEPVYNAAKAGAAHYSNGQSQDPRIGKTLVVGPAGMDSPFWEGTDNDTSAMMSTKLVAQQINKVRQGDFDSLPLVSEVETAELMADYDYCFAQILRAGNDQPQRVVVGDIRG